MAHDEVEALVNLKARRLSRRSPWRHSPFEAHMFGTMVIEEKTVQYSDAAKVQPNVVSGPIWLRGLSPFSLGSHAVHSPHAASFPGNWIAQLAQYPRLLASFGAHDATGTSLINSKLSRSLLEG